MKRLISITIFLSLTSILFFCNSNQGASITEEEKIDSFVTINMIFAGDIMGHQRQIDAAYCEETKTYDYVNCFKYVKPVLTEYDLSFGNLEVTLPGKPPYEGYPQFKSPDALAYALKDAGFNVMVTANNHSNDGYGSALIHTIDTLRGLGFYQTGTFKNMEERDSLYPLIFEKNSFRIALLNYTYGTNGIPDEAPTFVNLIDRDLMIADIQKAKEFDPDIIIAIMHWGDEYKLIENSYQRNNAQILAEHGVDLIIGAHPHVIQPVKYTHANEADSVLTVFSLGNYISNQFRPNTDGGMMFEVSYRKNIFTNEVIKENYHHHIVWRYRSSRSDAHPHGQYFIIPVAKYEAGLIEDLNMPEKDIVAMNDFTKRMRKHFSETSVSTERLFKAPVETKISKLTGDLVSSDAPLFHIQVLATSNSAIQTFNDFFIDILELKEGGFFKYITNGFESRTEAERILHQVHELGYSDAFIVKYFKNKRVID